MTTIARERLSYANVIATIALFVALGGGAYAAKVAKNSVGANQIKKNAVAASEIKANAVGASETAANSVGSAEVVDGSLLGADIAESSLGQVPSAASADTLDGLDSSAFQPAGAEGAGKGTGGTVASGSEPVLFALAEGTLTLDCNGGATGIDYANNSGAGATVFSQNGIHSNEGDGIDVALDGLEDVNPAKSPVADATGILIPFEGSVATGTARRLELAIVTDQHFAFVDAFVDTVGGNCLYAAELDQYAL